MKPVKAFHQFDVVLEEPTTWFVVVFRPQWVWPAIGHPMTRTAKVIGTVVASSSKEAVKRTFYIFLDKNEPPEGDHMTKDGEVKFNYPYLSAWDDWVCIELKLFVEQITEPGHAPGGKGDMLSNLNAFPGLQKLCKIYDPCPF